MTQSVDSIATANGTASLSDRVKGLRLNDRTANAKGSSGGSTWLPWIVCLAMALTWASFGIRAYTAGGWKSLVGSKSGDTPTVAAGSTPAPKKDKAAAAEGEMVLEVKGNIIAAQQIQVGPDRVSGKVMKLYITEGQRFKAKEALAEIDDVDYRADYESAKAAREMLEANLAEMKSSRPEERKLAEAQADDALATLEQAIFDMERIERIVAPVKTSTTTKEAITPNSEEKAILPAGLVGALSTSEKARIEQRMKTMEAAIARASVILKRVTQVTLFGQTISEKEVVQTLSDVQSKSARLEQSLRNWQLIVLAARQEKRDSMEAQIRQAKAREVQTKEVLDRTIIRAPVDGIILSKRTEIGNLVNALSLNASFNGGICEMADLTNLEVDLEVQERDIRKVYTGQDCIVRADAYPERQYSARVDRIMPVANSSKAIIPIRVKIRVPRKEEGKYLKPQMGAVVTFYKRDAKPETAEAPDPVISE